MPFVITEASRAEESKAPLKSVMSKEKSPRSLIHWLVSPKPKTVASRSPSQSAEAFEVLKVGILVVLTASRSVGRGVMAAAHNGAGTMEVATITDRINISSQGKSHVSLGVETVQMKCAARRGKFLVEIDSRNEDRSRAPVISSCQRSGLFWAFSSPTDNMYMYHA